MLVQLVGHVRVTYHLKTNDTASDNSHFCWDFLEVNGAGAGDDLLLIDGQAREGCSLGAGGNEDILAADSGLAAFDEVHSNGVLVLESTASFDVLDVVLLEQELDALGQARYGSVLCFHHCREIKLHITNLDTAALGIVEDLVVKVRVVEERLGGDAADVQAGSAERAALLDTRNL